MKSACTAPSTFLKRRQRTRSEVARVSITYIREDIYMYDRTWLNLSMYMYILKQASRVRSSPCRAGERYVSYLYITSYSTYSVRQARDGSITGWLGGREWGPKAHVISTPCGQ